jgi:hypothetical protein
MLLYMHTCMPTYIWSYILFYDVITWSKKTFLRSLQGGTLGYPLSRCKKNIFVFCYVITWRGRVAN